MESLVKDIKYGIRGLVKRPGFTAIALITLALGIGANTAIFSVVNAVLLRPLQFKDPEQLVIVWEDASYAGFPRNTPAPANYVDWKNQNQSFADMAATAETSFNLTGDGEPERVAAHAVTANFFPLFGVQPLIGRSFVLEEDQPGAGKVALICRDVMVFKNSTSLAMNPGCFGANLSTTTVHGRPSAGLRLSSKPCANSAITPMYDLRRHSPSVTTSSPAHSCSATTEWMAPSIQRR